MKSLVKLIMFSILITYSKIQRSNAAPNSNRISIGKGLFSSSLDSRLWVYDDDGVLVRLTLELPIEEATIIPDKSVVTKFHLFTLKNENVSDVLIPGDLDSLKNSNYDANKPTTIVTHGWRSSTDTPSCLSIKDAYMQQGDGNIILVDWRDAAGTLYIRARTFVEPVAEKVANMIDFLYANGMDPSKTTLIGHSLGAHVMGIAGNKLNNVVNHVVGLDPAGPLFNDKGPGQRISPSSGKYVEIVHTNAGYLGLTVRAGHHDFFPNGGTWQVGCRFDPMTACSHGRAFLYYAEAISTRGGFYGLKCNSYKDFQKGNCGKTRALMGNPTYRSEVSGSFFFRTKDQSPFSLGVQGSSPASAAGSNFRTLTFTI